MFLDTLLYAGQKNTVASPIGATNEPFKEKDILQAPSCADAVWDNLSVSSVAPSKCPRANPNQACSNYWFHLVTSLVFCHTPICWGQVKTVESRSLAENNTPMTSPSFQAAPKDLMVQFTMNGGSHLLRWHLNKMIHERYSYMGFCCVNILHLWHAGLWSGLSILPMPFFAEFFFLLMALLRSSFLTLDLNKVVITHGWIADKQHNFSTKIGKGWKSLNNKQY